VRTHASLEGSLTLRSTDLGFTRDRNSDAQVGYSRLAMARAARGLLRTTARDHSTGLPRTSGQSGSLCCMIQVSAIAASYHSRQAGSAITASM